MCLAIPMKVIKTEELIAHCEYRNISRRVSLMMLPGQTVQPGEFVMVQLGYAVQVIEEEDALKSWELVDEVVAELDLKQSQ